MVGKFEGGSGDTLEPEAPATPEPEKEDINYYYKPEDEAEIARTHTKITKGQFEFAKHAFAVGENATITHTDYVTPQKRPQDVQPGHKFLEETPVKVLRAYQDKNGVVTHAIFEVLNKVSDNVYTLTGRLMMLKTEDIILKINLNGVANPIQIDE